MDEFSIGTNFEGAAARRNQGERRDALAEFENLGRQTDGLRRVVSNDAVFDRDFDFHPRLLSRMRLSTQRNCVKLGALLSVACRGGRFVLFGLVCSRGAEEH
jgi:hypothetical protein